MIWVGEFCCIYRRNVIIYQYRIPLYYGGRKMSKKTLEELAALLDFVKADLAGIEADYEDPFVEQLQNSVRRIKKAEETIT